MKQYIVPRLEWSMTENALITFNSIDAVKKKTFNSSQNRTKEASIHSQVFAQVGWFLMMNKVSLKVYAKPLEYILLRHTLY